MMEQLIAAVLIDTIRVGRLRHIQAHALTTYVLRRRQHRELAE
jgi:hypothetical protein